MRVTAELATVTASRLSQRDRQVIEAVGLLGLLSARQIERLFWSDGDRPTQSRLRRRALQRLVDLGVLARLERRIGGVRAGSDGFVYTLNRLGRRLYEPHRSGRLRSPDEPGVLFVHHALAVSDLYVKAIETARAGRLELLGWEAEPACHRSFTVGLGTRVVLKPDGLLRVGLGAFEDRYFVELDTGTHHHGAIRRKLDTYLSYYKTGSEQARHGVFPKVLWVATNPERARRLGAWIAELPSHAHHLFAVTTTAGYAAYLTRPEASS